MSRVDRTGTAAHLLGWATTGGMGVVAATQLWRAPSVPVLVGAQGVAAWALVAAYPVAGIALWKRRTALALVATGLAAVHLALVAGAVSLQGPRQVPDGDLPLRLVSANVLYSNPDLRRLGNDIAAQDADVVVLQEVTSQGLAALRSSTLWSAYPYRATDPQPLFHGSATFSRFPIVETRPVDVGGPPMLMTDLRTPAGDVRVVNVHTVAPLTRADARLWATQFPGLRRVLSDSSLPIILAGDFNATLDHAPLAELVDGDVRDAFVVAGRGLGATWPQWDGPVPPLMRLDHVLVAGGISVGAITDQASVGSDHRRVVVDLGLPARTTPAG